MICRVCGSTNDQDATFCIACGASAVAAPIAAPVNAPAGYSYAPAAPAPARVAAQPPPSVEIEALNYSRYIEMLCEGQGLLAQLAIKFYYVTGLKSYLVTHHDCFVVPDLQRDAAEITTHIKQAMDGLGYEELQTTFLYMKTEHIQTLPYLSRSMVRDHAGVVPGLNIFGAAFGAARLALEVFFGVFYLVADLIRWLVRAASQSAGLTIRAVGREGNDELLTEKRLLLASTYRHTRTYTYVRDVGPETYVGWFTHHEPLPGANLLLGTALFVVLLGLLQSALAALFGSLLSSLNAPQVGAAGYPILGLVGVVIGIVYFFWIAPALLNRFGALPQPRYLSCLILPLYFVLGMGSLLSGLSGFARRGSFESSDPFMMLLVVSAGTAFALLWLVATIVFFKSLFLTVSHFDQFDAETHAKIVQQRIAAILTAYLESAGYTATEIGDILSQNIPGAGRYRRARA